MNNAVCLQPSFWSASLIASFRLISSCGMGRHRLILPSVSRMLLTSPLRRVSHLKLDFAKFFVLSANALFWAVKVAKG